LAALVSFSNLSIVEAFAKAGAYLRSAEAERLAVVGITYNTREAGLVEFTLGADGGVAGRRALAA
jgi:hypothetical protein